MNTSRRWNSGAFPPIDGERKAHAEGDHVVERDRPESIPAAVMELNCIKLRTIKARNRWFAPVPFNRNPIKAQERATV
jgi:hypothetical protein